MSIVITINGIDRSSLINWNTLTWDQALTNEADTMSFQTKKFGDRTFIPNPLDEVIMHVNGEKVFGGNILMVDQNIMGVDALVHNVKVKDYSHIMDRRLVIEKYTDKPLINIINDIRNRYANKIDRIEIADFSETEIWIGGSVDTVNYRLGEQARKITSTNNANEVMDRLIYLNLEPNGFSADDFIELEVYVDNFANLDRCRLFLSSLSDFSTDYFYKDITSQLTKTGWNLVVIDKADFLTDGAPDWTMIYGMRMEARSIIGASVEVTFDNYQVLKPNVFTRNGSLGATQNVKYMSFNYETPTKCLQRLAELFVWNWYVDENKDIHMFAKFDKIAPFNLTDDSGKYIFSSLQINNNADQLRNSIFVRGSDYLGDRDNEDLTHQADGLNKIFKLGFRYKNVYLTQNGVEKAIGVDNLDKYQNNQGKAQLLKGSATSASVGDNSDREYRSQEVIVTKAGRRRSVKLNIKSVGSPIDVLRVGLYSNTSDHPSGTLLSSVETIAGADLDNSFSEYEFTFDEAFTNSLLLAKDDKYHIRVNRSGATDAANYYKIDVSDVAEYDGYDNEGTVGLTWTRKDSTWYFIETINYEILHSFQEKILIFQTPPAALDELLFEGDPFLPVFVLYRDNVSVAEFGEYQFKIKDPTIKTKAGAKQRAQQEITSWANEVSEGSFSTYENGLRAGQTINIQSTARNLNTDYVIQRITASPRTPDEMVYSIQAITTKTFSMLYWLQKQIANDDKDEINDDEFQEKIEIITDEFGFETEYVIVKYTGKVWGIVGAGNDLVWDGGPTDIWI